MQVLIKGRVLDVKEGKSGERYITMNDTEEGGSFQIAVPGASDVKIDQLVNLHAVAKPGIGKYGLYLKVVRLLKDQ